MATVGSNERSPLLRATSPRANGGHSSLNPHAAAFTFVPGARAMSPPPPAAASSTHLPEATALGAPAVFALAPAPAPVHVSVHPAPRAMESSSSTHASAVVSTHNSAAPHSPPRFAAAPPQPLVQPQLASTVLVRTRSHSVSSSNASHESAESGSCEGSGSSESSICEACPTRRAFQRAHYIQFAVSGVLVTLAFVLLAWWKHEIRFAELIIGASAWLAGEAFKQVVFELLTWESKDPDGVPTPGTGLVLPTSVHVVLQELLRLGAIILVVALLPDPEVVTPQGGMPQPPSPPRRGHRYPHEPTRPPLPPLDVLFFSALWFAMGWALVEIIWGTRDFWRRMRLYDDVLGEDTDEEAAGGDSVEPLLGHSTTTEYGTGSLTNAAGANGMDKSHDRTVANTSAFDRAVEARLDRETSDADLDARIRALEREELEAQLGVPLYEIPVAVVVVWRVDSILLSLVAALVLSLPFRTSAPTLIAIPMWPTFGAVVVVHILLSMMWILRVRHVGIPAISYITLIVLLFLLFAALGAWGALV
ncbi:BZ3500_MvSof-1268-A1-R1_Chr9g10531 [Microbotryum saponariae]|uniref:BZ3500_MvSof-1268-A1-R1_Chr9g10531 protein n=1 Tax=Microbotryum saponariae TaxID=289078 RepID=A0A2X0KA76_9BASI|nr:BZ3501_MvSof-1269-A2-R1_Chr9g10280 [Microbotryum saponariae]SDA00248.1 BZ3500_MvSof-1268-A1-R1_Chr9g10531 [Microbotryum saponariae]